ncbi:hypothetical protein AB205_0069530 [Aquarana catesbeiana]|uniref:KRAB domain-containing protein n=1 Tax=Aquarana catesbeiana TaxID=8400 RepID=A0A2G9QG67_AQUCT|nr:hypothetical protein AB205_0069530 [Aquarana catesbeiana]
MTERILDLTLEIIYLLTGEGYTVVKKTSGEYVISSRHHCVSEGRRGTPRHITVTSSVSLIPVCDNKKILEVTKKIIDLLTREVPIRCQDVTVYFSMEEWKYLEGHKDLYKDVMMETQRTLNDGKLRKDEAILDLTLEIIYLLTGEDCAKAIETSLENTTKRKSPRLSTRMRERQNRITVPPPTFLSLERNNKKKILEVTQKIINLLTGEVPIRCQDVAVYFSMEEWEYLEGNKDLYKDIIMENQPPLTSPGKRRFYCKGESSTEGPLRLTSNAESIPIFSLCL